MTTSKHTREQVAALYRKPLLELMFEAAEVHRAHHAPSEMQCSSLLSIKTGNCPEDCGYCSQSAHHSTGLQKERLLDVESVVQAARNAAAGGADRFCMGAAWRSVEDNQQFESVLDMVRQVKALGLETCATLGMVNVDQAHKLEQAGLDYYNHNLDTSPEYYSEVVSTRTYQERLDCLDVVRSSGMKVCCGGILGMGESEDDRIGLIAELANLTPHPESVPINALVPIPGTPMEDCPPLGWEQMVRAVATARILMPTSYVRLSAGRRSLSEEAQAMCFLAGANSIFLGDKLLTTPNCEEDGDRELFRKLGMNLVRARGAAAE